MLKKFAIIIDNILVFWVDKLPGYMYTCIHVYIMYVCTYTDTSRSATATSRVLIEVVNSLHYIIDLILDYLINITNTNNTN